jgi:hypothetical protein
VNRHATPYGTPTRKGGMQLLVVLGLLLALVVASCAAIFVIPFAIRQRSFDAHLEWLDLVLAVCWRLIPIVAVVMALRIVWRRLGWTESVRADKQIDLYRAIAPALGSGRAHAPAQIIDQVQPVEALPAPAVPSLPDVALLSDVLAELPRGRLCYGVTTDGPMMMTFGGAYHILYGGDTRSGKSNALDSLLVQLHHQTSRHGYKMRLLIGDFKRELRATWQRSPLVETVETDPTAIAEMLDELTRGNDGILQRYSRFERYGEQHGRVIRNIADYTRASGQHLPLTFMCLDELNALLTVADRDTRLADSLRVVLQLGAGAGVYVASGAQYLSAKVFSRDGSKQFVSRALFGTPDPTLTRVMFGGGKIAPDVAALVDGRAGRGLIRTAGQAQPVPFQALRCDEDDILEAVRLITDTQPTMPRVAEPLNKPRTASEPAEPAFTNMPISPEIAPIIQNLVNQGWSKTKVIETLFSVKRGGSERYKELSTAYDAIVRGDQ